MGLDMYLDRYPRYKGYTPRELAEICRHCRLSLKVS